MLLKNLLDFCFAAAMPFYLDLGGGGGSAPSPDPLIGQAALKSANLADRVYADNKEALTKALPYISENMATQAAAGRLSYDQSKTDIADYNTYGRTAMQRQAVGHGLLNYVAPEERSALYDLYASKGDSVRADQAATAASGTGSGALSGGTAPVASSAPAAGGFINVGGRSYTPEEFRRGMTPGAPDEWGGTSNPNYNPEFLTPAAQAAANAAGYTFKSDGSYTVTAPTATQSSAAPSGTTSNPQLASLLKSSGVAYKAPAYEVAYKAKNGATVKMTPEKALEAQNKLVGKRRTAAQEADLKAQMDAMTAAGYKVKQNTDGTYAFEEDPAQNFALITKAAQDSYASKVEAIAQKAGIKTDSVLKAEADANKTRSAASDKAIFDAETGLTDKAISTETRRAADQAGTDATQAISKNNAMMLRQAGGMTGFDPNKFARVTASNGVNLQNAAMMAGGVNAARENARREVLAADGAGTANTINTTRGLPSQSLNFANSGQGQGNSAAQNGTSVIGANNAAAAPAFQGWGQAGQLANTQYANQLNSWNAQQKSDSDGFGSLLAGVGGLAKGAGALGWTPFATKAAGAVIAGSSKEIKEDKRPIYGALESLRKLPVEDWKYKDGVEDGGEHVGPYAEDVKEEFGDQAAPGGKMLDLVSMNGLLLKGLQELADKVDTLSSGKTGTSEISLRKIPAKRRGTVEVASWV